MDEAARLRAYVAILRRKLDGASRRVWEARRRHDEAVAWAYRTVARMREERDAAVRRTDRLETDKECLILNLEEEREQRDELAGALARVRAVLAELVWVTNVLGVEICDYCGVPRAEPVGKDGACSCAPLRAGAGTTREGEE